MCDGSFERLQVLLAGVGVESDSPLDSEEPQFPLCSEKVVGEGWTSFGGVSMSGVR